MQRQIKTHYHPCESVEDKSKDSVGLWSEGVCVVRSSSYTKSFDLFLAYDFPPKHDFFLLLFKV